LKLQVAQDTEPGITFRNIHVLNHPNGRVVLFDIPAAPRGIPIAWKGHYYARAGESLISLGLNKQDEIRRQTIEQDWTAQTVAKATLADLDEAALDRRANLLRGNTPTASRLMRSRTGRWPPFLNVAALCRMARLPGPPCCCWERPSLPLFSRRILLN